MEKKKFSEIVAREFPRRAIRIRVGNTMTYMGTRCIGLDEMKPEQVQWLDNHKYAVCWYRSYEIEFVYRASKQYEQMVWG